MAAPHGPEIIETLQHPEVEAYLRALIDSAIRERVEGQRQKAQASWAAQEQEQRGRRGAARQRRAL